MDDKMNPGKARLVIGSMAASIMADERLASHYGDYRLRLLEVSRWIENIATKTTVDEPRMFYCPDCDKDFETVGYANPVFYADTVANCPICGGKCWEKPVKITYSEYNRLKELGIELKLFN